MARTRWRAHHRRKASTTDRSTQDLAQKRTSYTTKAQIEPFGHGRAEIRERRPATNRHARPYGVTEREKRHILTSMIGRSSSRVVAVVGGDKQQVFLSESTTKPWQCCVKLALRPQKARNVV